MQLFQAQSAEFMEMPRVGLGSSRRAKLIWHAFDGRQGSTFDYPSLLTDEQRLSLKASLLSSMNADGPVKLKIRALAVKGGRK
jgi:hypothetical protein